jgi:hypothetical protein
VIDVSDTAALRAEAERRQRLRAQGATTFETSDSVHSAGFVHDRLNKNGHCEQKPAIIRDASIDEKTEQLEVRKRFVVCGFRVYNLSQPRASKQSAGLPDLWLMHERLPIALWWESKRQVGGKFSSEQLDFARLAKQAGIGYGSGDRYDAERYLVSIGRAELVNGVLEPIPYDGHPF